MAYRKDWGQPAQGGQGFARTMKTFGRKVNLSSADLSNTGNVVGLFVVPAGFITLGLVGPAVPAFGTGLVFNVGDAGSNNRYLSGVTAGAAGGALPNIATTGLFFRNFLDTEIQLTVTTQTTAAATAGVLELYLYGFMV